MHGLERYRPLVVSGALGISYTRSVRFPIASRTSPGSKGPIEPKFYKFIVARDGMLVEQ
jgi:hypothetical protein